MPRLDGTGPEGAGPMTGGGFGRCKSSANTAVVGGRGMRRGARGARNMRRDVYASDANFAAQRQPSDSELTDRTLELEKMVESLKAQNEKLVKTNEKLQAKTKK